MTAAKEELRTSSDRSVRSERPRGAGGSRRGPGAEEGEIEAGPWLFLSVLGVVYRLRVLFALLDKEELPPTHLGLMMIDATVHRAPRGGA